MKETKSSVQMKVNGKWVDSDPIPGPTKLDFCLALCIVAFIVTVPTFLLLWLWVK